MRTCRRRSAAGGTHFGDSVIRLSQGDGVLNLVDSFTPHNQLFLQQNDLDVSSGLVQILPAYLYVRIEGDENGFSSDVQQRLEMVKGISAIQFRKTVPVSLAADLSLLRVKPPEAMQNDWDHFEQLDIVPAADVYPPLNQTGCKLAL